MRNICVLLILCVCCHALQVLHPPSLAGHYNSYPIPNYSTIKPVTSILTVLSPIDACTIDQVANKNELNGTITIADPSGGCNLEQKCVMARQLNLQGIIFANGFLEGWYGGFFSKACEGIAMDMYIFDAPIGYLLSLPEPNVTIFFTADENPWVELDDGRVLSTADGLLGGIDLFILAFAVFKLFRYVRYQKSKYIPILTLSFVVIGAILRILMHLDPMGSRGIILPSITYFFFTLSLLISDLASFVIAYNWHLATQGEVPMVKRWAYPILVWGIVLAVSTITEASYLFSWTYNTNLSITIVALSIITRGVVSTFFVVSASRVAYLLYRANALKFNKPRSVASKMLMFILIHGIATALILICNAIIVFVPLSLEGLFVSYISIISLLSLISSVQVLIFETPKVPKAAVPTNTSIPSFSTNSAFP